jgi:hypothetical protein
MVSQDNSVETKMTAPPSDFNQRDDSSYDDEESMFEDSSHSGGDDRLQVTDIESHPASKKSSMLGALLSKETLRVNRSKLLVYIFMAALAAVVGTVAFVFISAEEDEDMEVKVRF